MKKAIIIILSTLLTSCAVVKQKRYTKNELTHIVDSIKTHSTNKTIDTIRIYKDREVIKEMKSTVKVDIDCDSLGNVKNMSYSVGSGKNKFNALIKNNKLILSVKLDSIVNSKEVYYKSKYKQDSINLDHKYKEEYSLLEKELRIKEKFSLFKHWKCFLIFLILILIYYWNLKYKLTLNKRS